MILDSKDETSFIHELLLTDGQLSRFCKDSVNNLPAKAIHS